MKLIWHIIRKDILRDRWALLMWAALYAGQVVLGLVLLQNTGRDRDWLQWMQLGNAGLIFLQSLVAYVLVARWVHADSPLGTDVHWITRPVSRGRMFAAKAIGAGLLFVLLPVLLLLPWWLWCEFDARTIFWTAVETAGWQLMIVAPAFLVATLTTELSRVLLWSILAYIALVMGIGFLRSGFPPGTVGSSFSSRAGWIYTSGLLAALVFVAGSLAVAAWQYLSRRPSYTGILTGVLILGVVLTGGLAQLDLSEELEDLQRQGPSPEITRQAQAAKFVIGPASPDGYPGRPAPVRTRSNHEATLITDLYIQGLPEHLSIWSNDVRHTWSWPDGTKIHRSGYIGFNSTSSFLRKQLALPALVPDPETQAWRAARQAEADANLAAKGRPVLGRDRRIIPPTQPGLALRLYATVPPALITRVRDESPAYEVILPCVLSESVIRTEVPIVEGARAGRASHVARVLEVNPDKDFSLRVGVLTTAPAIRENGLWASTVLRGGGRRIFRSEFYAMNPNGEIGHVMNEGGSNASREAFVGGVLMRWSFGSLGPQLVRRADQWVPRDPEWRTHYRLLWLGQEPVARVVAKAATDRLVYRPSIWEELDPSPGKPKTD